VGSLEKKKARPGGSGFFGDGSQLQVGDGPDAAGAAVTIALGDIGDEALQLGRDVAGEGRHRPGKSAPLPARWAS